VVISFFFDSKAEAAKADEALKEFTVEDGIILCGKVAETYHRVENFCVEDEGDVFRVRWQDKDGNDYKVSAFR
jgi:hypothetical protein